MAGSARFRYNYYSPDLFGLGKTGTKEGGILLERYLLSTDWQLHDGARVFFELGEHVAQDKNFPAGPNDKDQWDINQAFMDLSASLGGIDARARVGRQYVTLGSSRLVGLRDGPNVRERFDGGRVTLTDSAGITVEALALRDVVTALGPFDDSSTHGDQLWGVYAVLKKIAGTPSNIDLYYLGLDRNDAAYARGVANERRHSFGTRVWGEKDGWDWNWEAVLQTGTFGNAGIAAWTAASITGYTFATLAWKPRLFLSANIASGDNPKSGNLGTFNPLFPRLPYFEEAGFIAPENFKNLQPGLQFKPIEAVLLARLSPSGYSGWRDLLDASPRA
jgi:alginate export protein